MADLTQTTSLANGRADRPGYVGLLLGLATAFVLTFAALSFVSTERAQPLILGLLALLAMGGVFFVFALAVGAVRFAGGGRRRDITRFIADSSTDGLIAVESSGRILYANERYRQISGAEATGEAKPVERLFTGGPEIAEAIYRLSQAGREARSATEEIRMSPALGGERDFGWYRLRVRPVPHPGGKAANATLWSLADVTADRERHENVFQELQHAVDYLDHAPAGFLSVDPGGAIVYMNATLAGWLDYDLAQVGTGGLKLADVMPGATTSLLTAETGRPAEVRTETIDLDLRRRNGSSLPVRVHHRVAFGSDGRPGSSRTLVLNRSQGVDTEDGQRVAEIRFARFFNSSPLAIATLGPANEIRGSNSSFVRLFGRAGSGPEGGGILGLIADGDRSRLEAAIAATADGRLDSPAIDVTVAAGSRSARVWVHPVSGADGAEERDTAILYALDTTEQRLLEQQFAQAQKMQAIGQLAGGVAHDFNNVLQAIIGYADLLLASHRPTDPSFQDLMQIKQNANRAASLVRQLLAFSRRQTLRPELVRLGETLSDLSLLLKRLLGERVQLDLRQGRDLWFVKADVNQLEQVIINLVVNARDAMPEGGTVSIATQNVGEAEAERLDLAGLPAADYVRIDVGDTGTGIPPDVLDKIFEPFFTTKELGKGTGLGLSTVFGIVKQSGGFIYVDSTVGIGTTFSIYLPRHVPEPEAEPKPVEPVDKRQADMTGQGTILLVEDEEAVRAVNSRALTARGYTVLAAASGIEALEIIEARGGEPVDLVLSDVVMPEMDGPTLLVELRKRMPGVKVVFVSGYAEDAFAKHLPEGEQFAFLPKPFSLKQLVETVKQAIAR